MGISRKFPQKSVAQKRTNRSNSNYFAPIQRSRVKTELRIDPSKSLNDLSISCALDTSEIEQRSEKRPNEMPGRPPALK
jgi:hypothetical protein